MEDKLNSDSLISVGVASQRSSDYQAGVGRTNGRRGAGLTTPSRNDNENGNRILFTHLMGHETHRKMDIEFAFFFRFLI